MTSFRAPENLRRGQNQADFERQMVEAADHVGLLAAAVGKADLGGLDLLDMGCGTKLTEYFLRSGAPIGSYTGVDVWRELVDELSRSVDDPRFRYADVDFHNEMYNQAGPPLSSSSSLPVHGATFDVISLFSVFTHLNPTDYRTMLEVLRPYADADSRLLYSLYLNEVTDGGYGLIDRLAAGAATALGHDATAPTPEAPTPDFDDIGPNPLQWAVFSRAHALELLDGTGWEVVSVNDPTPTIQHYIVARAI